MSKKKKVIVTILVILVIAAAIGGAVYAYLRHQSNSMTAEVQPVSSLNWYYGGDEMTSYGMVTNDFYQDVYLLDDQTISEVYVEEGQEVAVGDPLLAYDMTMTNLKLEMQGLEVENINNKLILANRELEKLRNTTPIPEQQVEPEIPQEPVEKPVKWENAYFYIPAETLVTEGIGKGTPKSPYVFYCAEGCYVEGGFLEALAESETEIFVKFQMFSLETYLVVEDQVNSISSSQLKNSPFPIETYAKYDPYTLERLPDDYGEEIDEMEDLLEEDIPEGYTAAELAAEIKKTENQIKDLDLQKRKAQLQLEQMQKLTEDGVVKATVAGTIKTVGDMDNPPQDGSAFITVSGSEGLYVTGSLSELMLGDVQVGQTVYANSWESGMSFEATIQEISPYPAESSNSWGEGNPNVSYYPYTAYIANTDGLRNGEYVDLTMTAMNNNMEGASNVIYLQKAYVREENGKSYVMMADENDRLKKQYVETGKTIYGEAVEIKSGLTQEDRIAFPYGKTAKEGVKVEDDSGSGIMDY